MTTIITVSDYHAVPNPTERFLATARARSVDVQCTEHEYPTALDFTDLTDNEAHAIAREDAGLLFWVYRSSERDNCDLCKTPLSADDTCPNCGVYHGDECPGCGQRGYHADPCDRIETTGNSSIP